jgi:hypothetical protein
MSHTFHPQTFENRSSLAPNPAAGLLCVLLDDAAGAGAGALLHPPKSSSALTFGGSAEPDELKVPPPPGTMLWLAREVPLEPHPKLPDAGCGGAADVVVLGLFAELHASFDPQASSLPQPPPIAGIGAGTAGFGGAAGCERLKTDCCGGGETTDGLGGGGGDAGVEKSNRSPKPELEDTAGAAGEGAESNAPKPLEELKPLDG